MQSTDQIMGKTLKRILVPVEVTKTAETLLSLCYAGQFAAAMGAELVLLHNSHTPELTFTAQNRDIQVLRALGERVLGKLPGHKGYVPFECVVRPGNLQDSVKSVVQDAAIDLVMMQAEPLLQPNEEGHADHAAVIMAIVACPVIVVPASLAYKKIKRLVFATDFTDRDPKALEQIGAFAAQVGAHLTMVQAYSKAERSQLSQIKAAMGEVEKLLNGDFVTLKLLEEEDMLEGLSDFAEQEGADMLVLATQDNYLMQRLFSNAYVKTMAYHTRIPLLSFKQHKKKPCSGCCTNCAGKKHEQELLLNLA